MILGANSPEHRKFDDVAALADLPLVGEQAGAREALDKRRDRNGEMDDVLTAVNLATDHALKKLQLNRTVDKNDLSIPDHTHTPEARAEADSANTDEATPNLSITLISPGSGRFSITSPTRAIADPCSSAWGLVLLPRAASPVLSNPPIMAGAFAL